MTSNQQTPPIAFRYSFTDSTSHLKTNILLPHSSMYSVKTIVNLYGETLVNLNVLFNERIGCREKSFCHLSLQTVAILKK